MCCSPLSSFGISSRDRRSNSISAMLSSPIRICLCSIFLITFLHEDLPFFPHLLHYDPFRQRFRSLCEFSSVFFLLFFCSYYGARWGFRSGTNYTNSFSFKIIAFPAYGAGWSVAGVNLCFVGEYEQFCFDAVKKL